MSYMTRGARKPDASDRMTAWSALFGTPDKHQRDAGGDQHHRGHGRNDHGRAGFGDRLRLVGGRRLLGGIRRTGNAVTGVLVLVAGVAVLLLIARGVGIDRDGRFLGNPTDR